MSIGLIKIKFKKPPFMLRQFQLLRVTTQLFSCSKMPYYAVAKGRTDGIFSTWDECEACVKGFKGAKYKKFKTIQEAENFITSNGGKLQKQESKQPKAKTPPPDNWPAEFEDHDDDALFSAVQKVEPKKVQRVDLKAQKRTYDISKAASSANIKRKKYESIIWSPVDTAKFSSHEFLIDSQGYVIVYTDGACENNGQKGACAGLGVYFGENHPLNASKPVSGRATNNCGEIQAASHAIKVAKQQGIKKLCVSTDSQFLINAVTAWIKTWKRKGWKLKDGGDVKNIVDFKELDGLLADKTIEVKWNYVKGHEGITGNEMADKLAKEGAQMYKRLHC